MTHIPARKTIHRGITMRSRLEAGFAHWLDEHQVPWTYEPRAYSGTDGFQYLPDFEATLHLEGEPTPCAIEVKPESWAETRENIDWAHRAQAAMNANGGPLLIVARNIEVYGGVFWMVVDGPGDARGYLLPLGLSTTDDGKPNLYICHPIRPWMGEWWKGGAT